MVMLLLPRETSAYMSWNVGETFFVLATLQDGTVLRFKDDGENIVFDDTLLIPINAEYNGVTILEG
jgi:hypothetical protein